MFRHVLYFPLYLVLFHKQMSFMCLKSTLEHCVKWLLSQSVVMQGAKLLLLGEFFETCLDMFVFSFISSAVS